MREGAQANLIGRRQVLGGMASLAGLSIAGPALAQIAPRGRDLIGFVAGIDTYAHLRKLKRAVNDATAVSTRLGQYGYRLHPAINASQADFYDSLNPFLEELTPNSAAFIFLSGHGVQVAGRNYLLPANSPRFGEAGFMDKAIYLGDIMAEIAAAAPAQTIVILDACREGAAQVAGAEAGFAATVAPANFFIAYSAGSGEVALDSLSDDDTATNGLFTRHFLDEMAPDVPIYNIVMATRAKVTPAARDAGHFQHPAIYDQSSRPYRLDGHEITRGAARPVEAPGTLAGTGVLIAASDDYQNRLVTPIPDAYRFQRAFEQLGAEVTVLRNTNKAALLEACRTMAARGYRRLAFFWAGMGGAVGKNVCCLLTTPAPDARDGVMPGYAIELVSEADLIEALRGGEAEAPAASGDTRGFRVMTEEPRDPIYLFLDTCLHELETQEFNGTFRTTPALSTIQEGRANNAAVLAASSYFQASFDAVDGASSSPFSIALLNALAIPGLSLTQLAHRVREEVETLTDRQQTPALFAGPEIEKQIFVELR